jgi:DNA-binding transcriptional regulator YiaG
MKLPVSFKVVRFVEGRKHRFRHKKESIKGISAGQLYERKQRQRRERAKEIDSNDKILEYIKWISEIQSKLRLSNEAFAARLGISAQSVRLWKRKSGHFPSERVYKRLLLLEKECEIPFYITHIRFGVKFS